MKTSFLHLPLFVCAFFCHGPMAAHAQCQSAALAAENMTVMVNGNHASGAGIVMAVREPHIYIATAKHVITDERDLASITVKFRSGEQARISPDAVHTSSRDVAFFMTEDRDLAGKLRQQSWQVLRSRSASKPSTAPDRAFVVGQGGGQEWIRTLEPERIITEKGSIRIQSATIQQGFLGGGVFDPNGLLIGIITSDTSRPAEAMTIEAAIDDARRLGLPVDLSANDLAPLAVALAPLAGERVPADWDQLVRENIRHKLEQQLAAKGLRPLDCENTPKAIRILGAVQVVGTSMTTDVAVITWKFVRPDGLTNTPPAQRLEFTRLLPWTDIWAAGSDKLSERADEVGDYAVTNFMKDFH
jgi:hypothetical protein